MSILGLDLSDRRTETVLSILVLANLGLVKVRDLVLKLDVSGSELVVLLTLSSESSGQSFDFSDHDSDSFLIGGDSLG